MTMNTVSCHVEMVPETGFFEVNQLINYWLCWAVESMLLVALWVLSATRH
jgi:hypothetical protein